MEMKFEFTFEKTVVPGKGPPGLEAGIEVGKSMTESFDHAKKLGECLQQVFFSFYRSAAVFIEEKGMEDSELSVSSLGINVPYWTTEMLPLMNYGTIHGKFPEEVKRFIISSGSTR